MSTGEIWLIEISFVLWIDFDDRVAAPIVVSMEDEVQDRFLRKRSLHNHALYGGALPMAAPSSTASDATVVGGSSTASASVAPAPSRAPIPAKNISVDTVSDCVTYGEYDCWLETLRCLLK